jgi:hypothetical protein
MVLGIATESEDFVIEKYFLKDREYLKILVEMLAIS